MKKTLLLFALFASCAFAQSQDSYTSYLVGDPEDADIDPQFGVVLMGGASENDQGMSWFLERANGGDVVVLRASGSDGYNDYMYSDFGLNLNSVETIVFNDASAAMDPYVIERVQQAEAIWMAGGDQWDYVSYWKDTQIEQAINDLLLLRTGVVGGTSAGMAVLGGSYFNAMNGTVYSEEMLSDPFNQYAQFGHGDFFNVPYLARTITDTHYDDPDRRGRHVGFLARIFADTGAYPKGIACDEYTAVCIDENGFAYCFGEAPEYEDYVYFVRPDCDAIIGPQVIAQGQPLTWNASGQALKVLRINATMQGDQYLSLVDWQAHNGGTWFDWTVTEGVGDFETEGTAPDCSVSVEEQVVSEFNLWPNPTMERINFLTEVGSQIMVYDARGQLVLQTQATGERMVISVSDLAGGLYFLLTENGRSSFLKR